jgi:tetratricopeptide (TPR) repeat protein
MTLQQALKTIQEKLSDWQGKDSLWIHFHGEDGSGKKWLINRLLEEELTEYHCLLRHNFEVFPWQSAVPVKTVVRNIYQSNPETFRRFLQQFPVKLQRLIVRFAGEEIMTEETLSNGIAWEYNLLRQFIVFLARKQPLLLVLEGIFDTQSEPVKGFIRTLEESKEASLLVVSTGKKEAEFNPDCRKSNIHLEKLSVRETEKIVINQLRTNAVNARIITNHLHIKSNGLMRNIQFMTEAFYRPLLSDSANEVLESSVLRQLVVSAEPERIFRKLAAEFSDEMLDICSFLSRLEDPFPEDLFVKIWNHYGLDKKELKHRIAVGVFGREKFLQKKYIFIAWDSWKDFLRKHTSVERVSRILDFFKKRISRYQWEYPVEFSTQFFNGGEVDTALSLASREARLFARFGMHQRAFDRYAFLRRNLPRFPKAGIPLAEILKEMGVLQKEVGLYENAFESFREMREALHRRQHQEWIEVSLEMADTLFQMDALSETRYLLKELRVFRDFYGEQTLFDINTGFSVKKAEKPELKIKKTATPRARFFADILMGELEQNFGHADYARRHFDTALSLLPEVSDDQLISRLYGILKGIYLSAEEKEKYLALLQQIPESLPENSPYHCYYRLEKIKYHISQHDFATALPLALSVYRDKKVSLTPAIVARVRLYLAEIYAYYGKWYLSRSHLKALLKQRILILNSNMQLQVTVNLGIVEKELGHYAAALGLLLDALDFCLSNQLIPQIYQVRIHLGHIYLLVFNYMRAREHLLQTLEWAEENQQEELLLAASLFLVSYEMQQTRFNIAEAYLKKAETLVGSPERLIDRLNFYYYQAMYQLKTGNLEEADKTLGMWEKESSQITKFENLWFWFSGKLLMEKGAYQKAQRQLEKALERILPYRLPYLELQILRDLARVAEEQDDNTGFKHYASKAHQAFQRLLKGVGDEILRRQIQESREYESVMKLSG